MKKKDAPNYNRLFESSVNALQCAFNEYMGLYSVYLEGLFVDRDGNIAVIGDTKKMTANLYAALAEVTRLKAEVEKYRELKD